MEHTHGGTRKAAQHSGSIRLTRNPSGSYIAELRGIPSYRAEAESADEAEMLLLEMVSDARGLGLHPRAVVALDPDALPVLDDAS